MTTPHVGIIGLGYVGLPLAVALARHVPTVGFDVSPARVAELKAGRDRTGEVPDRDLRSSTLVVTDQAGRLQGARFLIITVPTPVGDDRQPDLGAVEAACRTAGAALTAGAVVVLESTVYPGVTEEVCGPILEAVSGLACGRDFFLGYSPERMNPGDREHTVDRIVKVVAGQTPAVTAQLAELYGMVTRGGTFQAASIKVAEAAKVIENTQRDVNIAFVNEATQIFNRLGLSIHDVLAAARTKWNFLPFAPGLVGGHCIGVDPYYLADCAQRIGHDPEIILAGRRINDGMAHYIADQVNAACGGAPCRLLVLGLTFKEDVPDLRNTKVTDLIAALAGHGHTVEVHDPLADPVEAHDHFGLDLLATLEGHQPYDGLIGAVAHQGYRQFTPATFQRLLRSGGLVADVKGMWRDLALPGDLRRWEL